MTIIRSQQYAQEAYPLVAEMQKHQLKVKYCTLALNFPSMILQSGLSQAIGFLMAKGKEKEEDKDKNQHQILLDHLATLVLGKQAQDKQLHQTILTADLTHYQLLTRQTLEAASWLKRYTQALLEKQQIKESS